MISENTMLLVKLEQVYGTDPTPTTSSNFLPVHNVTLNRNLTYLDPKGQDGSLSPRPGQLGQKYIEISFDYEIQVDNDAATVPPMDPLLQACGWDDKEELGDSAVDGKYYPASPRGLKCTKVPYDSGGATEISVGDTIYGEDSGAYGVVLAAMTTSGTWVGEDDAGWLYVGPVLRSPGLADQTTGTGLSDLTMGGTYTGNANTTFEISCDLADATDTFKWRQDSGAWTEDVAMTGAAQTLADGVTVTFGATTGHTLNDVWTITCNDTFENDEAILVSSVDCATVNGTQISPSVTIWVYEEDILQKIVGCKGDVSFDWTSGNFGIASFRMIGQYAKPSDSTFPTEWTDAGDELLMAMGGTFAWGTEAPVIESLKFGLNNTVNVLPSLADTHGVGSVQIVDRAPELTFNPETTKASDIDVFTAYEAVTQTAISYSMTNGTVTCALSVPYAEIKTINEVDRNGVQAYEIPCNCARSSGSVGDDEMYLQFS